MPVALDSLTCSNFGLSLSVFLRGTSSAGTVSAEGVRRWKEKGRLVPVVLDSLTRSNFGLSLSVTFLSFLDLFLLEVSSSDFC